MGYKLRREVRDVLPPGLLTTAERLVLLEIADLAGDDTRVAKFGPDQVALLVDMTASAVRKHVQRIGYKGIDLRIQIGIDGRGLPVYAHAGMQTNYRIPALTVPEGGQLVQAPKVERVDNPSAEGGQPVQRGWTEKAERVDGSSTPSPHVSSKNFPQSLSQPSTPAAMLAALGVDERERDGLIRKIEEQNKVKSPGFWFRVWGNGSIADCVDRARAAPAAAPARPPHCGKCDENRQIAVDRGGRTAMARCPDCHPAATAAASQRPRNGWDGPYRNPDDPDTAYADYQFHGVETAPRRPSATDRAIAEGLAVVAQLEEQERLGATFTPAVGATPHHDREN